MTELCTNPSPTASGKEVFAEISKISYHVPGVKTADQAMADIASKFDLDDELRAQARSFLDRLVAQRRDRISRAWKLSVERTILDELPKYDPAWQDGLTFISAPMGSGKSRHCASPFITESMGTRYTVAMTPSTSLCREQAQKFGIDLYSDLSAPGSYASSAMSVCLPSLDKPALQPHIGMASAFVMDEWSQSLAMLAKRGVCNQGDFDRLGEICSTLDAGIFADAFLSDDDIHFVTSHAKPGLPVRIFEVRNKNQGFKAKYTYGASARGWIIQEILAEMDSGGKAWVSCEGRRSSQTIGEILQADGYRVLIVNKRTKETPEVQAFLANAEDQCLQYDAVIHSPTITSGMSITGEKNGQHFTRGFFLGGGWRLQPTVCAQMLRRVRYLTDWSIGIAPNNGAQSVSEASERRQVREIEHMTGRRVEGREAFIRGIEQRDANQRADFASAMVWLLEDMRFTIERVPCSVSDILTEEISRKAKSIDDSDRAAILAAPVLTEEQVTELQRSRVKTPEDHHALTAADIRAEFGVDGLTPEIVDFYDDGRGVARLRRFENAQGLVVADQRPDRALNDNGAIQRELYRYMFEGIDMLGTFTKDIAETVLDRIMARRFTLAVFGCVPATFARITEKSANRRVAVREDKDGHICEFKRPKYAVQVLGDVLDMIGLKLQQDKQGGSNGNRSRERSISSSSLDLMRAISHAHIAPLSYDMISHVCADQVQIAAANDDAMPCHVAANDDDTAEVMPSVDQVMARCNASPNSVEYALTYEVACLLNRFKGLPASDSATVWLPLADERGFQKSITISVPDCFMVREEHLYELPKSGGAGFSFQFDIGVSERVLNDVRACPAGKRAFIMEGLGGDLYVVYVDALGAQARRQFIRDGYDKLAA